MNHDEQELQTPSSLLDRYGKLMQVGWSRQPLLDCNLEKARFYSFGPLQRFRVKRWDYYGITMPKGYFSATLAHLGYAGQRRAGSWVGSVADRIWRTSITRCIERDKHAIDGPS